jgi:small subunit ribosomal protein S14
MVKKKKRPKNRREYMFKGRGKRKCRFCGGANGLIRSYGLFICRRCFREIGERIGFRKY